MATTLHLFNPDNDLALANNNENFQSPASATKMGEDLSALPAWWAEPDEAVLVTSLGEVQAWAAPLESLLPKVEWYSFRQSPSFDHIEPWGWNPALRKRLLQWGVDAHSLPSKEALESLRSLSSRQSAVTMLPYWNQVEGMCGESMFCTSEEEIAGGLTAWPKSLLKAPYSSSGKGLRWGTPDFPEALRNWCRRILKSQGGVVVEPLYQRVVDFATEWKIVRGVPTFAGFSLFETDENGAYKGNRLAPDEEILKSLSSQTNPESLRTLLQRIPVDLSNGLSLHNYTGYMGIDMMLCRLDEQAALVVHPCVEINLRRSMGWVARHFFDRYVHPESRGEFRVDFRSADEQLLQDHREMQALYPLRVEKGRIVSGYLSLAPVTRRSHYRAYVLLSTTHL